MNRGIMLNIDNTHFWYSRWLNGLHPGPDELRAFVNQYAGTQVTDLMMCIFGRLANYPARSAESVLDKYHQTRENGRDVDYKNTIFALAHEIYEEKGLDPYAIWIDEARQCGLRLWLSMRMNDCHEALSPTSFLHPDFFHDHPEYRRVRHREANGYFDCCYDYAIEAVRRYALDFLKETLERYQPDGLELDWQREAYCFQPGGEAEGRAIMTGFMREVKALVRRAEALCGHDIPVCVRVPADPEDALEMGFDVVTWADEGLVQVVCPTARWGTTDNDMPIELWKRLLRGTGVQLAPGIEVLIRSSSDRRPMYTNKNHVVASAAQYGALGADKIYLYNYFDDPNPEQPYWKSDYEQPDRAVSDKCLRQLLNVIGDPELAAHSERCHMITYRDMRPAWRIREQVLPARCEKPGEPVTLRIVTGDVPPDMRARLRLGLRGNAADALVYINSRPARLTGTETCVPAYTDLPLSVFETDGALPPSSVIEIATCGAPLLIDYADITLSPGQ